MLGTTKRNVGRARELRRKLTLPEGLLWQVLKTRPQGLKFRRQHPAGPYRLDFYCEAAKLAVEVDGAAHDMGDNPQRDMRRDRYLAKAGIRTLRIPATEVLQNIEGVIPAIVDACAPAPTPPPLDYGERSRAGADVPRTSAAMPGAWRACASPSGRN